MATAYMARGIPSRVSGAIPAKLLLDPYAKAFHGAVKIDDALFGYETGFSRYRPSATDSAAYTMRSVVVDPFFDWDGDL
jgi:isoamylase